MDKIKFLGTAGARFVVTKQLRKSGGIWLTIDNTNMLIDPGPGSLVNCLSSRPKLNPIDLDGIILTHRHIDHSNDINIMIEAMTNGGFDKKGIVFAPRDALDDDPVILHHFRGQVDKIEILIEKKSYSIGNISFSTPVCHDHGVETFGLNIFGKDIKISLITDASYFPGLESYYTGDIQIINVVLMEKKDGIMHLSIEDAIKIIETNKPKLSILTHFGMKVLRAKPRDIAKDISEKTGLNVIAASDGMEIKLDEYRNV